jgi:polar amino acid transport system substrate-binding protein
MPFIKRIFIFLGIMVLLASGNGLAQDNKTVSVITLPDYAPYTRKKSDSTDRGVEKIAPGGNSNALGGYSWDIVRESFHSAG